MQKKWKSIKKWDQLRKLRFWIIVSVMITNSCNQVPIHSGRSLMPPRGSWCAQTPQYSPPILAENSLTQRKNWGISESLNFHLGPPFPTLLYPVGGPPQNGLFLGWPACRAGGLWPSSTSLDTPRRMGLIHPKLKGSIRFWPSIIRGVFKSLSKEEGVGPRWGVGAPLSWAPLQTWEFILLQ
jgi:hypothetical protein